MSDDAEVIEGELIVSPSTTLENTALAATVGAEIDKQISTAKAYPRSIKEFKAQATELATLDEDTAASMFYSLRRGGKKIEGPSIRMAEVVAYSWKNLRYESRIVEIAREFVTAEATCMDLERNNAARGESKRRITNKHGVRYNEDMIQTTCNAACSIALREAIFKTVPRAMFKDIFEKAKLTSVGKAKSMSESRHAAIDWFKKAGATEEEVLTYLERKGIDEITLDDLVDLRGLVTAIKDGVTTLEDALRPKPAPDEKKVRPSAANETLPPVEKDDEGSSSGVDPALEWQEQIKARFELCVETAAVEAMYDIYCGPNSNNPQDVMAFATAQRELALERIKKAAAKKTKKAAGQQQLMETAPNALEA